MTKLVAGWMLFFVISFSFLIPTICLFYGYMPVKCWSEKRLGNNEKYQPMTIYVKVCELSR